MNKFIIFCFVVVYLPSFVNAGQCRYDEIQCGNTCVHPWYMCHGLGVCNDNATIEEEICTNSKNFECHKWQTCENVPGAKYHQNECYIDNQNFFSCVNRMDIAKVIFKLNLFNKQEKKFNITRQTDENGLKCDNELFFPWKVVFQLSLDLGISIYHETLHVYFQMIEKC